jgi:transposase
LQLTEEIKELDERTTVLLKHADPAGILTSAPGVATITAAAILGRLGDPNRFTSLAGARAFTGLVPILDSSGLTGHHGGLPNAATPSSAKRCSWPPARPDEPTPPWPRNTTGS